MRCTSIRLAPSVDVWVAPRYDVGAGTHLPDPTEPARCLCGHSWPDPPTEEDLREHRFGPKA